MTAPTYGDRVQETFTTTGTGSISLAGAVTGYQAFSAVVADAGTCYYAATDGTNWEVGLGTYATSGNTLARTTILSSSNAGLPITWAAGTKQIWLTFPAAAIPSGAVIVGTSSITGGSSGRILYDNGGLVGELATTGSGNVVCATSPVLVTPALGTPASGDISNCTGSPALTAPALGTPASGDLSNCTGTAGLMTALGVGSIIMAHGATDTSYVAGTGVSASALVATNISTAGTFAVQSSGDSLTGTWQPLQSSPAGGIGKTYVLPWQRTA